MSKPSTEKEWHQRFRDQTTAIFMHHDISMDVVSVVPWDTDPSWDRTIQFSKWENPEDCADRYCTTQLEKFEDIEC